MHGSLASIRLFPLLSHYIPLAGPINVTFLYRRDCISLSLHLPIRRRPLSGIDRDFLVLVFSAHSIPVWIFPGLEGQHDTSSTSIRPA